MVHFQEPVVSLNGGDEVNVFEAEEEEPVGAPCKKAVIMLIDMDFYAVQLLIKRDRPDLLGQDVPIIATNEDSIILAANYQAKKAGVARPGGRREVDEARQRIQNLEVLVTDTLHFSLLKLQESDKILDQIRGYQRTLANRNLIKIEKASDDEFFVDVTDMVYARSKSSFRKEKAGNKLVSGLALPSQQDMDNLTSAKRNHPDRYQKYEGNPKVIMEGRKKAIHRDELNYRVRQIYPQNMEPYHVDEALLVFGAIIAEKILYRINKKTGYQGSAGIGHNKLLAKLACGRNKPDGITILTSIGLHPRLSKSVPFTELPGYASVTGTNLQQKYKELTGFELRTLKDIQDIPHVEKLIEAFQKLKLPSAETKAIDLVSKARGNSADVVQPKYCNESMTFSVSFKGIHSARSINEFNAKLSEYCYELVNHIEYRVGKHRRLFTAFTVHVKDRTQQGRTWSRSNQWRFNAIPSPEELMSRILDYLNVNGIRCLEDVGNVIIKGSEPLRVQ